MLQTYTKTKVSLSASRKSIFGLINYKVNCIYTHFYRCIILGYFSVQFNKTVDWLNQLTMLYHHYVMHGKITVTSRRALTSITYIMSSEMGESTTRKKWLPWILIQIRAKIMVKRVSPTLLDSSQEKVLLPQSWTLECFIGVCISWRHAKCKLPNRRIRDKTWTTEYFVVTSFPHSRV